MNARVRVRQHTKPGIIPLDSATQAAVTVAVARTVHRHANASRCLTGSLANGAVETKPKSLECKLRSDTVVTTDAAWARYCANAQWIIV